MGCNSQNWGHTLQSAQPLSSHVTIEVQVTSGLGQTLTLQPPQSSRAIVMGDQEAPQTLIGCLLLKPGLDLIGPGTNPFLLQNSKEETEM